MGCRLWAYKPCPIVCCIVIAVACAACSGGGSSEEAEDIMFVSSSCDSSSGAGSQNLYCSLDDAIAAAATKNNPVLVLNDGEYSLGTEITRKLTIRSYSYSGATASLSPKGVALPSTSTCTSSGTIVVTQPNPRATITASADTIPIRVSMADTSHALKLQGVRTQAPTDRAAVFVTKGQVTIEESTVTGPLIVAGVDASAFVSDSVLASEEMSEMARIYASAAELNHNVYTSALDCDEDAEYRAALIVNDGASFVATGMEIANHRGIGLCVDNATATFCDSQIHDINLTSYNSMGRGAYVTNGGHLAFKRSNIYDCYEVGVLADGSGTTLSISDGSEISEIQLSSMMGEALGVALQNDAELTMSNAAIQDNVGVGLYLASGASASVSSSTFSENRAAGIASFRSTLTATGITVRDTTRGTNNNGMGIGLLVDNADGSSTIDIDQSTFENNYLDDIYMNGDGSLTVTGSNILTSIAETYGNGHTLMGHGIFAQDVCGDLTLGDNYFEGNEGAHIFLDNANATLSAVGTYIPGGSWDFVQQACVNACITPLDLTALYAAGFSASNITMLCGEPLLPSDPKTFSLYLSEAPIAE